MDKRKLIGTIIGVAMFAALIAGATFAWLTFNTTVTSGTYDGTAENFVIEYAGGTDINTMLDIVSAPTVSNVSKVIKVSAYRKDNSSVGTLNIKLTSTSSDILTTGSVIRYAVCSATSSSATNCTGSLTSGSTGVLNAGDVNKTGEITLYSTTDIPQQTSEEPLEVQPEDYYYWIYFWIDAATFTNDHLGKTYSGYVHASATQR